MDASQIKLHGENPTGIENEDIDAKDIQVYPNPVKDQLFIKGNFQSNVEQIQISIYNITGQKIISKSIPTSGNILNYNLNMTGTSAGIYYVVFDINNSKRYTKKIIKQ